LLAVSAAGLLGGSALASHDAQAPLKASLTAVAPAHGGSGKFSGTAVSAKDLTTVKWQLSVSHLSGPITAATLRSGGPKGIALPLCQPCPASSKGNVAIVSSIWKQIQTGSGEIVIATRAHPNGELSGKLKLG
jgi:hypothetical protein